jgi:UDP-glucuronate decarboxylase
MDDFVLQTDINLIVSRLGSKLKAFSGKRTLVTGGRGFLGRYFSSIFASYNEQLKLEGMEPCELVILDNFITSGSGGSKLPKIPNMAFVEHDVIKPFYPERPVDFIIHAAGIASPFYYRKYPLETLEVATTGLKNVLELARKNPNSKLIFFSSSEIYGDPSTDHIPTTEDYRGNVSCLGPRACYDESKRLGETLVRIYHEQFGVHACSVRPFNVFGPGMQKTDYRVLPNFGVKILNGDPVQIYGTGDQTRTFCYITDAMCGFLQVLLDGHPGESYNIGNPSPEISMIDFAARIGKVLNREVKFEIINYPSSYPGDEPNRRCPDITKARNHLGFEPVIDLDYGLKSFFGWAEKAYT